MSERLSTIQTKENLNHILATDEKGNGGANHRYQIVNIENYDMVYGSVKFQNGARKLEDSVHGVLDSDLLEIVRHRLQCFQAGPFASEYNEHALKHVEEALHCMNARVEDRIKRSVLGTNNK